MGPVIALTLGLLTPVAVSDGTRERRILECPDHEHGGCPRTVDRAIAAL